MNKHAKKWLLAAVALLAIGAIVFAAAMTAYHWDFSRLSTDRFETNTYEITEEFGSIKINTETADVLFAVADDSTCRVVCYEAENRKHSVRVQDGTLAVSVTDNREWFDGIGIHLQSPKITVYLPITAYRSLAIKESTGNVEIPNVFSFDEAEVFLSTGDVYCSASVRGSLEIKTTTGNVCVNNASIGNLNIRVTTGAAAVSDVACRNLSSSGSTGDLSLKNVNVTENISVERSTGAVSFDAADAAEIFVKTSTGDVTGTFLTEKVFIAETSTGDISVPKTGAGGKCEIITSTGNIHLEISGGADE